MRAPEPILSLRPVAAWTPRRDVRPSFARAAAADRGSVKGPAIVVGPALVGLVTSLVWGGLASAAGLPSPLALAIAALTGACAFVCTTVMVAAGALAEGEGDGLAAVAGERHPSSVQWN